MVKSGSVNNYNYCSSIYFFYPVFMHSRLTAREVGLDVNKIESDSAADSSL